MGTAGYADPEDTDLGAAKDVRHYRALTPDCTP
jgi:hypothetical protein